MSPKPAMIGTRACLTVALTCFAGCGPSGGGADRARAEAEAVSSNAPLHPGLLFGRITLTDGTIHEGRLRFGGDEEALWIHTFNGARLENRWLSHLASDERPRVREGIDAFGVEIAWDHSAEVDRPFMARLGDIARIEAERRRIRVVLKSGTEAVLERFESDDLADGLRVWDADGRVVDVGEWRIRSIEFRATPDEGGALPTASDGGEELLPLHGTVHTPAGAFTGLLQWDRKAGLLGDVLVGENLDGETTTLSFARITSIDRESEESSRITLDDGRTSVLSGTRAAGARNRGVYVDDPRYGRVLISWNAFRRLEAGPGGTAPGYEDFEVGRPLSGEVVTRSGERFAGRLVYDLDESETTETLDAPRDGVDYLLPFGRIASIEVPEGESPDEPALVTLRGGEVLELERAGDLGPDHAGMLVFFTEDDRPRYVPWEQVARIAFHPR